MKAENTPPEVLDRIREKKTELGDALLILTHHYQRRAIVDLGDFKGDSFDLSRKAAQSRARRIVFCGVHFMAESARILCDEKQTVQIPDEAAGCWMSDMADHVMVQRAWDELEAVVPASSVTPVTYMNSDAVIKAFCGRNGGIVCTSSNAREAFAWGFAKRAKIFFFPDQHLGQNTANQMGILPGEAIIWDPARPLGGNTPQAVERARVILWKGYCLVHTRFNVAHMASMRKKQPGARIVVHPECTQEVVNLADAVGSTSFIVKYVADAAPGSRIIVGTEINLVRRLAAENVDKSVVPLYDSFCPNMYKISPAKLLETIERPGKNLVTVPEDVQAGALLALERMLALPA
jgi:quinolinate synthase